MVITRIVSDAATLVVTGVLILQIPKVIATSNGVYDGAILPAGFELPRLALSVPLFISTVLTHHVAQHHLVFNAKRFNVAVTRA